MDEDGDFDKTLHERFRGLSHVFEEQFKYRPVMRWQLPYVVAGAGQRQGGSPEGELARSTPAFDCSSASTFFKTKTVLLKNATTSIRLQT